MTQTAGQDRLIVALDVDSIERGAELADQLRRVRMFKLGWRLLMAGLRTRGLAELWQSITATGREIFVDLKVPDIGNTVADVVGDLARDPQVRFLTLHENMQARDIERARAARGESATPQLLMVPFVSSLSAEDFPKVAPAAVAQGMTMNEWILERAGSALDRGCDGIIASGDAIALCRNRWPRDGAREVVIVSPGIRPAGSGADDHKRLTTPTDAIRAGADYLVVGRPILHAPDPAAAADAIISEVDAVLLSGAEKAKETE
ncbi:MAG: orotidine-5'-phosphate decarboxylase [Acidobacteria bacterium]|nr:orotidine-5'-phosphate decarboxylase [Acidobacteriota bacterium]